MTEEVIRKFFLTVGASYRQSEAWKQQFEAGGESDGKSAVLRSGRFGIGVLAAFLLGDRIEVSTRSPFSDTGYVFESRLEPEPINVCKDDSLKVGTEIRIPINTSVAKTLSKSPDAWDFFALDTPHVKRTCTASSSNLRQGFTLPAWESQERGDWSAIAHSDYQGIHWTFSWKARVDRYGTDTPILWCNGIVVGEMRHIPNPFVVEDAVKLIAPSVSVFDPDGNLPLNLQRDRLTENSFPFQTELTTDMTRRLCAHALHHLPTDPEDIPVNPREFGGMTRTFLDSPVPWPYFWTPKGNSIATRWHVVTSNSRHVLFLVYDTEELMLDHYHLRFNKCDVDAIFATSLSSKVTSKRELIRQGLTGEWHPALRLKTLGQRILGPKGFHENVMTGIRRPILKRVCLERDDEKCCILAAGTPGESVLSPEMVNEYHMPMFVVEIFLERDQPEVKLGTVSTVWNSIIKEPIVPFSMQERKQRLSSAFESLEDHARLSDHNSHHDSRTIPFRVVHPD